MRQQIKYCSIYCRRIYKKTYSYVKKKILGFHGSKTGIAHGFAIGASISCFPIVGAHFLVSYVVALMFRVSSVAALFGTIFGNPWTFPVIWWLSYRIGMFVFNFFNIEMDIFLGVPQELDFSQEQHTLLFENIRALLDSFLFLEGWGFVLSKFQEFLVMFYPLFIVTCIGSLPLAVVVYGCMFKLVYGILDKHEKKLKKKLMEDEKFPVKESCKEND